jgi:hypothetical protein
VASIAHRRSIPEAQWQRGNARRIGEAARLRHRAERQDFARNFCGTFVI